jgi:hypothetical protein
MREKFKQIAKIGFGRKISVEPSMCSHLRQWHMLYISLIEPSDVFIVTFFCPFAHNSWVMKRMAIKVRELDLGG